MSTSPIPEPRPPQEKQPVAPNLPVPAGADGAPAINHRPGDVPHLAPPIPPMHGTAAHRTDWSQLPELQEAHLRAFPRRRLTVPLLLFIATCLSTYYVGAADWRPQLVGSTSDIWRV